MGIRERRLSPLIQDHTASLTGSRPSGLLAFLLNRRWKDGPSFPRRKSRSYDLTKYRKREQRDPYSLPRFSSAGSTHDGDSLSFPPRGSRFADVNAYFPARRFMFRNIDPYHLSGWLSSSDRGSQSSPRFSRKNDAEPTFPLRSSRFYDVWSSRFYDQEDTSSLPRSSARPFRDPYSLRPFSKQSGLDTNSLDMFSRKSDPFALPRFLRRSDRGSSSFHGVSGSEPGGDSNSVSRFSRTYSDRFTLPRFLRRSNRDTSSLPGGSRSAESDSTNAKISRFSDRRSSLDYHHPAHSRLPRSSVDGSAPPPYRKYNLPYFKRARMNDNASSRGSSSPYSFLKPLFR